MSWRFKTVPVFLAGLWPALPSNPESGARVVILDRMGGEVLIDSLSDEFGQLRGQLPKCWIGKQVHVVIVEPSFKYDHLNPTVERWGLFLAVRQEKDLAYCGRHGAKTNAPEKWESWNSTQQYIEASKLIGAAIRQAKVTWPLREFGFVLAIVTGIAGFFVNPIMGFALGVVAFAITELLAHILFRRGY
ncbi:MAG: hypothetical protein HYU74_13065 [Dechloromonas sp.]|nr:hypothetical protein [Dechloromonas sp.]